uniref:Uncharacterized protein n=1 Tax=Haptolina ericina TaxID=156174 RepID=A0A7S3BD38_9EUKA
MFDYYATFGASDDIIHIQNNGFKQFVDDCHLAIQGSKHCGSSHLDQLFIMVNTGSEVARALLRQEWIQCLIRITAMRHDHFASSRHERPVGFVEYSSIADDLDKLIVEQIMPRLDKRALPDLEGFRKEYCYTAEVSFILEDHQATLRHLFTEFAKGDGTALYDELKSAKLLSFNEWRMLTKNIGVMNEADFSQRDMALVFSWSRLRVIDERPMKSRVRLTQLSFEDFCEAICRLAFDKALPTEEEAFDADCEDGGEFLLNMMAEDPAGYLDFVHERAEEPELRQEMWSQVNQLLTYIVRSVLMIVERHKGNQRVTKKSNKAGELVIDEKQAAFLFQLSGQGAGQKLVAKSSTSAKDDGKPNGVAALKITSMLSSA